MLESWLLELPSISIFFATCNLCVFKQAPLFSEMSTSSSSQHTNPSYSARTEVSTNSLEFVRSLGWSHANIAWMFEQQHSGWCPIFRPVVCKGPVDPFSKNIWAIYYRFQFSREKMQFRVHPGCHYHSLLTSFSFGIAESPPTTWFQCRGAYVPTDGPGEFGEESMHREDRGIPNCDSHAYVEVGAYT